MEDSTNTKLKTEDIIDPVYVELDQGYKESDPGFFKDRIINYIKANKKKTIIMAMVLLTLLIAALAAWEWNVVRKMELNSSDLHVLKGGEERLYVEPKRKVKWISSDRSVVTIDDKGQMRFLSTGKATITAKYLWKTMKCKVLVDDPQISSDKVVLLIGETKPVKVENTTFKIEAETDNELIQYENGNIKAIDPGMSGITFNAGGKELRCDVEVKAPSLGKEYKVKKGKKVKVKAKNWPVQANITWTASNKDIAVTEEKDGALYITGLNVGKTSLTASVNHTQYKTDVKVTGDQGLKIEAQDIDLGQKEVLSIKNFMDSYKVKWDGATEDKPGTALFEGKERGIYTVKATVDTGVGKVDLEKEIKVLEKKLNITDWSGHVDDSFELFMQDAQEPEYKYDAEFFRRDGQIFTALKSGETVIDVIDGEKTLSCKVTVKSRAEEVVASAANISNIIETGSFIYSNSGCSGSLDGALRNNNRKANCGILVTWAMQEAGLLEKGKTVYYKGGLKGSGASSIKQNPKLSVTYPNTRPGKTDLQPGDICGFMLNGRSEHIAIYAGKSDDGHLLWYTGGRDATNTGKYNGTFDNCGPRRQDYYDEIRCLIRAK